MFEIYNKVTGETVDPEKEFPDHGVVLGLDGGILLIYYGNIVASADNTVYGVRLVEKEK